MPSRIGNRKGQPFSNIKPRTNSSKDIFDYELDDYLLIRDDKVIAVSANDIFTDGDNPVHPQKGDTIAYVTTALGAIEYMVDYEDSDEQTEKVEEEIPSEASVINAWKYSYGRSKFGEGF